MANCRNTQQLNITCGTDVVLHDKLMFDGEVFDPNFSVDIECNLVNSLGKRTSLEYEIADEVLIIQIPWVDGRNAGCYGLEVKGKCNGKTWATYADSLIRYTRATVEGAAVVETESDWYDVTQVVSYRYSDSPLDEVVATIDDNYGEPTVTPTYEHNKLTLDFKNIRGNGIANVEQTTVSTEDEGVNETIITQDNGNTTVIQVKNGSKGSKGDKGDQGDSAVYNPDDPDVPVFEMANTTGQSTTKAMTQKAVTDAVISYGDDNLFDLDDAELSVQNSTYVNIYKRTYGVQIAVIKNFTTAAMGYIEMEMQEGVKYRLSFDYWTDIPDSVTPTMRNSSKGYIDVFRVTNNESYTFSGEGHADLDFTAPSGVKYLGITIPANTVQGKSVYVENITLTEYENVNALFNKYRQEDAGKNTALESAINNIRYIMTDETVPVIAGTGKYVKVSDGDIATLTGYSYTGYIQTKGAKKIYVLVPSVGSGVMGIAFYRGQSASTFISAKTFVKVSKKYPSIWTMYDVPEGANWFRYTVKDELDTKYRLAVSTDEIMSTITEATKFTSEYIDLSLLTETSTYIYNGKWTSGSGAYANRRYKFIPVTPNNRYWVENVDGYSANYSVFTTNSCTAGTTPSYAAGWTWMGGAKSFYVDIPTDGAYLCLQVHTNDTAVTWKVYHVTASPYAEELGDNPYQGVSQKLLTDTMRPINDEEERLDMLKNGIDYTDNTALSSSGAVTSKTGWRLSGYIPIEPGQHTFCVNYGSADSTVCALAIYNQNKATLSLHAASGTSNPVHLTISDSAPVTYKRYVRISYYVDDTITGHLVVDGKLVWSDYSKGKGLLPEEEKLFTSISTVKECHIFGKDSSFSAITVYGLKIGNPYRVIIDNATPYDSYIDSMSLNQIRYYAQQNPGGVTASIFAGSKSMPMLNTMDFIASTKTLSVGVRATAKTQCSFKVMGIFDDAEESRNEESSLVRNARYTSGSQPYVGLLHFSDLHGDQIAADEILKAIDYHGSNIDDVLCTGDVVLENADGSITYPQGTAWWQACGLAEKSLFVIGNHDNATPSSTQYDQQENSNAWDGKGIDNAIAQYYTPYDNSHGTTYHRAEGGCYWYKDYASAKIRLIGLDCMHRFDGIVDPATGQQDGDHAGLKHLTTEQEEWFVARLNETLDSTNAAYGYAVVVSCHFPLDDFNDSSAPNKHLDDTTKEYVYNHESTGGRVMYAKDNAQSNWSYATSSLTLEAKFSLRNRVSNGYPSSPWPNYTKGNTNNFGEILKAWMARGGNFLVWLCGHMHYDLFYYPTNYPDIPVMTITQAGSITSTTSAKRTYHYERCAANFVAIHASGTIKVVRIGCKRDQILAKRTYLYYQCGNKNILREG